MSSHSAIGRVAVVLAAICSAPSFAAPGDSARVLTLDDAIRRTRDHHHALGALRAEEDAARARLRDADRRANPVLAASHENFGGDLGGGRAETTLMLEQPIELGGDRPARAGLARSRVTLASIEREVRARELSQESAERFCDAWALQERAVRLDEAVRAADRAVAAAAERHRVGAAPMFERTRAAGFRSLREVERDRARAALDEARRRLAALWGDAAAPFDSLGLDDPAARDLPPPEAMTAGLEANPERRRAAAATDAEQWRVREAQAARVPDLQIGAGARHLAEVPGTGIALGLSLPLPLWSGQGGAVEAARSDRAAAAARERQTVIDLRAELEAARTRHAAALAAWEGVRDRVHASAVEANEQIHAGYRAGRLSYLDIQEGQRALLEAELLLIDAKADAWKTRMALEGLIGAIPDVPAREEP